MVNGKLVKFKYSAIVADHYRCRGGVENYNALRHAGINKYQIGLESSLGTSWWPIKFPLSS